MNQPLDGEAEVEAILEDWFAQRHRGAEPQLDELCGGNPHLVQRVRTLIGRHEALLSAAPRSLPTPPPPPTTSALLPTRLGDYRIKGRLGRGGMGDVYLAREESLDRLVALKVLRSDLTEDPTRRLRFQREAEITAALDHPHIVPVYATGVVDGAAFLAMKFLEGKRIDELDHSTQPRRLARLGARIADALNAAHQVGVIHRDVKPANLLVVDDHAYVCDFGLARTTVDVTLTHEGQTPGTLHFMAPEQLRGGPASLDPRVDIYGLGATLYACLAGDPPFNDDRPEVIVRKILVEDPAPPTGRAELRDLETIVLRAIAKEPERRFADAAEFALDLDRFAQGLPVLSRPTGVFGRVAILARRHRALSAVIACAVLVTCILGGLLISSQLASKRITNDQLALARGEVAANQPARAHKRLQEVLAAAPNHAEATQLTRSVDTMLQRDALLNMVHADRRYLQLEHLQALESKLVAGDPQVLAEPLTAVTRALLALVSDRPLDAIRLIETLPKGSYPRGRTAIAAMAGGQDIVEALTDVEPSASGTPAADDAVISSIVMRIAEVDPDRILMELQSPAESTPRLIYGLAQDHYLRGENHQARRLLHGLFADGVPRPDAHILLAYLEGRARRIESAHQCLRDAEAALQATSRQPLLRLAVARARIAFWHGDLVQLKAALDDGRAQFGPSDHFDIIEGQRLSHIGDVEAARTLFHNALDRARFPWNKRRAQLALFTADVILTETRAPTKKRIEELRSRADQLLQDIHKTGDGFDEAEVWVNLAMLANISNDATKRLEATENALSAHPDNANAIELLVTEAFEWIFALNRPLKGEVLELASRAKALALQLVATARHSPGVLPPSSLGRCALYGACVACQLGDDRAAEFLGEFASSRVDPEDENFNTLLSYLLEELGREHW